MVIEHLVINIKKKTANKSGGTMVVVSTTGETNSVFQPRRPAFMKNKNKNIHPLSGALGLTSAKRKKKRQRNSMEAQERARAAQHMAGHRAVCAGQRVP